MSRRRFILIFGTLGFSLVCFAVTGTLATKALWCLTPLTIANRDITFAINGGAFGLYIYESGTNEYLVTAIGSRTHFGDADEGFIAIPRWHSKLTTMGHIIKVQFPLWIPAVFFGIVGVLIWRSPARVAGNQCSRCGYSLLGITSDKCPECGEPISRSDGQPD